MLVAERKQSLSFYYFDCDGEFSNFGDYTSVTNQLAVFRVPLELIG